jgi:hypothetical protein
MKAPATDASEIVRVPAIDNAMFGRKQSAIGDGAVTYVNVRIVSAALLEGPALAPRSW